jgi:hypothetical protein
MTAADFAHIIAKIYNEYGVFGDTGLDPEDLDGRWMDYEVVSMFEMSQDTNFYIDRNKFLFRLNADENLLEIVTGNRSPEGVFTSLSGQTSIATYTPDTFIDLEHMCGIITSTYQSTMSTHYTKYFLTKPKI